MIPTNTMNGMVAIYLNKLYCDIYVAHYPDFESQINSMNNGSITDHTLFISSLILITTKLMDSKTDATIIR